jgi:hypothetical protein
MKRAVYIFFFISVPTVLAFCHAYGLSVFGINDTPEPFILQTPFIPGASFSPHTYQVSLSGNYGYGKYRFNFLTSFPLHTGGVQLAASGAITDAVGWNVSLGLTCPGIVSEYMSMRLGSSSIPFSASLAWRFAGAYNKTNGAIFAGGTYSYAVMRGYYRKYFPGPPDLFYFIKMTATIDITGSAYGLFAGIRPSVYITNNIAFLPFAAYRISFDTSGFYYHVRLKVLNDEPEKSGPLAFKYRRLQDPMRPIHGVLAGLEIAVYGVGVQGVVQFMPASRRTVYGIGLSYTHSFAVKKIEDQRTL